MQMFIKATFSQIQRKLSDCNSLMLHFQLGCMAGRGCEHWGSGAGLRRNLSVVSPAVPCERARIPGCTHWPPCGRLCTGSEGSPGSTVLLRCTRAGCDPPARTAPPPGSWSSHSAAAQKDMQGWGTAQLHGHPTVGTKKFWQVAS